MRRRGLIILMALSALVLGGLWWAMQAGATTTPAPVAGPIADAGTPDGTSTGDNVPRPANGQQRGPTDAAGNTSNPADGSGEIVWPDSMPGETNSTGPHMGGQNGPEPARPGQAGPSGSLDGANGSSGPRPAGAQPGDTADTPPPAPTLPTPARVPTPRERAEAARYAGGAALPRTNDLPAAAAQAGAELSPLDMARLADPEVWAEYWAREGYAPPDMLATPVRGKLMARLAQKGIAGATVRLFTFFPATSQLAGPVLPVAMEAVTDAQGFFACDLPVPARWPTGYARLALSVESEGLRLVDALLVPDLRPGESNEIGVFWAPEEPFELEVKVTAARSGLAAIATGRLDPRRWEVKRAAKVLALFSRASVGSAGAKLQGTWDILAAPPFVTLLENGAVAMIQQPQKKPDATPAAPEAAPEGTPVQAPQIGQPFLPLVFANDGYLSVSGLVTGPDDMPVAGATLTLTGDGDPRVAYTDSGGWFLFAGLRDLKVAVFAEHEDFIATGTQLVSTGANESLALKFEYRKPRVTLTVSRADNSQPVAAVWYFVNQLGAPPARARAVAADGVHHFEWDRPVLSLVVSAPGLKPQTVPITQSQATVVLETGLALSRRPRDYNACQWPEGWHTEGETACIWSLDDDHWVDYTFNFGQTEASFALELGVKNHSYGTLPLDNEFEFTVDVFLDGQKLATLSIPSDGQVPRFVMQTLGKLSGEHTLRLLWTNDRWIPGQLDANISYESIEILQTSP